jgi:hypothetical protein
MAAITAVSPVTIGRKKNVSRRIMTERTVRSKKIEINAAMQTDNILAEDILFSFSARV